MQDLVFTEENEHGARVRANMISDNYGLHENLKSILNFDNPRDLKVNSILELFNIGRSLAKDHGNCLGHRPNNDSPFEWISYEQFHNFFIKCAKGLEVLGVDSGNQVKILSYSKMSKETFILIFAAMKRRNVVIPLYDSLGTTSIEYIVNDASPCLAFCDTEKRAQTLLNMDSFNSSYIFIPFLPSADLKSLADDKSVKILTMDELIQFGDDVEACTNDSIEPVLDDLVYILYTSGSTGIPKGVKLCHRQFVFNITSLIMMWGCESSPLKFDGVVYYSYLPYQHSFENLVLMLILTLGCPIGISQGNLKLTISDLKVLKPNLMIAVPRVLERFRDAILEGVAKKNFISRFVFNWAYNRRRDQLISTNNLPYSMFYNIIFNQIHANFGGNLDYLVVGGAPMSREIEIFSRVVFGANLIQGYGLTETTAPTMVQNIGNGGLGEAGAPMPGIEIKLTDAPEYEYFKKDGVGELCVRGPNITPGYHNRPEISKEAFDDDGFFRSGDIAKLNKNGTFTIIDRCKNIFKLNQGEYIIPEKIENIYSKHPLVRQVMIYGESTQDYCVALVIVEQDQLAKFAESLSIPVDCDSLLENKDVKAKLVSELNQMGKEANLFGFEQPKAVVLDYTELTTANELLTPTFKIRRPQVIKLYLNAFHELYNK